MARPLPRWLLGFSLPWLFAPPAAAVTDWINPAGGSWTNPANWSNGLPSNLISLQRDARFALDAAYAVTLSGTGQSGHMLQTLGDVDLQLGSGAVLASTGVDAKATLSVVGSGAIWFVSGTEGSLKLDNRTSPASLSLLGGLDVTAESVSVGTSIPEDQEAGGDASLEMNGPGVRLEVLESLILLGSGGATASLVVDDGTLEIGQALDAQAGSTALTFTAAEVSVGEDFEVGSHSDAIDASLLVEDSTLTVGENFRVGRGPVAMPVTVSGSQITVSKSLEVGGIWAASATTLEIDGGSTIEAGLLSLAGFDGQTELHLSGGSVVRAGLLFTGPGPNPLLAIAEGTLEMTSSSWWQDGPVVLGNGTDAATVVLTETGPGNPLSPTDHLFEDGAVELRATTTLRGVGTVLGSLVNQGVIEPGASAGPIVVDGDYTQGASGGLRIEVGGRNPVIEYDRLGVGGTAILGGTLEVTLVNGFAPQTGDRFDILKAEALSGTFDTVSLPPLFVLGTDGGTLFVRVVAGSGCGIGVELALVLSLLIGWQRRAKRLRGRTAGRLGVAAGLFGLVFAGAAGEARAGVSLTGVSQGHSCFHSDTDGDQSNPEPPGSLACKENGAGSDVHAFATGISFTAINSTEIAFTVTAAADADAGLGTKYQGGLAGWGVRVQVNVAPGQPWELTMEQSIRGLLALDDDGAGSASARIGPQVGMRVDGTPYLFAVSGSALSSSPGQPGILERAFTGARTDVIAGTGPATLTLETDVLLEAYSSCETGSPPACSADADEAGVLLGFRDVDGVADPDVDRYLRWARAFRPDGYRVRLTITEP